MIISLLSKTHLSDVPYSFLSFLCIMHDGWKKNSSLSGHNLHLNANEELLYLKLQLMKVNVYLNNFPQRKHSKIN